jgi:heme/copper-type cytochrome/quinol oxidase subunit 2
MTYRIYRLASAQGIGSTIPRLGLLLAVFLFSVPACIVFAQASPGPDMFKSISTPADEIHRLSLFVLVIAGLIFVVVFSQLVYAVLKFRGGRSEMI